MKILLTGASGFLGGHLMQALTRSGHRVTPVSRRHGLDLATACTPRAWAPLLDGVDVAINAAGILGQTPTQRFETLHVQAPCALFEACVLAGVGRVVQISALGADDGARSGYHRSKRAADRALLEQPLAGFVLRPSLVHGPGGASARTLRRLARWPVLPVVGNGLQQVQPVHVDDMVTTVLTCLHAPRLTAPLDVVGPEPMAWRSWMQRLRAAQGLPPAPVLQVPVPLVHALMTLGQPFSPLLRVDNLRMLQAGNVADVRPLAAFLGRLPGPADRPDAGFGA